MMSERMDLMRGTVSDAPDLPDVRPRKKMKTPKPKRKRQSLRASMRFEVFKRDKFTCQYCGRKAPDVILQADHINPHSKGGSDEMMNLVTSCKPCNLGKSDKQLDDGSAVIKAQSQAEEIQERAEQLEMMAQWHTSLLKLREREVELLSAHWLALVQRFRLTDAGKSNLVQLLKNFSYSEIADGMEVAVTQYCGDTPTAERVSKAFDKIGGVCRMIRTKKDNPELAELHYIKAILRKRLNYCPADWQVLDELKQAAQAGVSTKTMKDIAVKARSWTAFVNAIDQAEDDLAL